MIEKLKQIYRNKIIENINDYNYDKYYYFYKPGSKELFGIEKSISANEYELIKTSYIEKKIYTTNPKNQLLYEYLFENKSYPFAKNAKIIIVNMHNYELKTILKNFFKTIEIITIDNLSIAFCFDSYNLDIQNYQEAITFDLGIRFHLHNGIYINQLFPGAILLNYISLIKEYISNAQDEYSDLTTPLFTQNENFNYTYYQIIDQYIINPILSDVFIKDLILTYFKNDLNVSKTAKDLYINRNSLLNKFDTIYKETGINLQKFSHACSVYTILKHQGK